ncbi:hypothetical protein FKM82_011986 [Ascaphus truei]
MATLVQMDKENGDIGRLASSIKQDSWKTCDMIGEEIYPEIETFIPYNPLDYESLEVPEEHKLSHLCLAGLPLWVSLDKDRFDALTNTVIVPMELLPMKWQCDTLQDFIPFFEDIDIDLPPVL